MRVLVTGLGGTLAPKLAADLARRGHEPVGWNRAAAAPEDGGAVDTLLHAIRPEAIAHLALGAEAWAERLSAYAAAHGVPFLFTSTAMVFDADPDGPHRPDDPRTARDDYGRYKIRCEDRVRAANPDAMVARIGWQIDPDGRGNNMLAQLDRWQTEQGRIGASRLWRPACSFMADTAAALADLLEAPHRGTHHLDSNAAEGHAFPAIVGALKGLLGRDAWHITVEDGYRHDQRLVGGAVVLPPLSNRLPLDAPALP